jgi:hypothetical protein
MLTCTILKSSGSRPRQPVDARSRCTLRGLSSLRGTPRAGTAAVPLGSQARQLVEHGRDHNRRALRPMPQLSDRRHRLGSEILAWQRQRMPHAPASNRYSQSTRLAQKWAAPIPANPISGAPNLKSHNHCPGLVGVTLMMLQWLEDIAAIVIGCGVCDFPSRVDRLLPSLLVCRWRPSRDLVR